CSFFFLIISRPPSSTLFPYTTLFRSMSWVRTFLSELHAWQWLGILIARLAVGLLFFLSGRGKLFVPERREQMRQTLIAAGVPFRSEEHTSELQSRSDLVCRLLLEKKK